MNVKRHYKLYQNLKKYYIKHKKPINSQLQQKVLAVIKKIRSK